MASSIVGSAAQQLGKLLADEALGLYRIQGKIESLKKELEWMERFLRDADTKQHKSDTIRIWVSDVQDLAYEAEDVIERYLHGVSHHRQDGIRNTLKWFSCIICTRDCWTLHTLGSDIDDLNIKISELTSRRQRYDIQIINPARSDSEYSSMSGEERRTYSHIEEDVVGLKNNIKEVVDQLLNKNVKVVGIRGIGGLGKTTLARKVFLSEEIQNQYACVWVYTSQEFESTRIFQEILSGLDRRENFNVVELPEEIDKVLKNKKCLVVIDDIWTLGAWKRLEPAFQSVKNRSSSKILLTTRTQDLLQHVDYDGYAHDLKPLSHDDSWELFKRRAFIGRNTIGGDMNDKAKDKEDLGRQMLTHCGGLPLAIVALGGILSTKKTVAEWKEVQQNISSYLMEGHRHGSPGIAKVLELSYQDLPFYLKPCFLYLGYFPEDYEITTEKLYHLWGAEGLLDGEREADKKQGKTSYEVGDRYLNELVQRSMVQVWRYRSNGRIKTCRVHDVMRDMCVKKGEEINFLNTMEWTKGDVESALASCCSTKDKKVRRCVVHWKGDDDDDDEEEISNSTLGKVGEKKKIETCCVRSFLVFPRRKYIWITWMVSKEIWKPLALLRVLDLQGVRIEGGLEGVGDLIHLRYLSLRATKIEGLPPRFYDLKYVETLDLRSESVFKMKLADVGKLQGMERLRHLYLPRDFEVEGGEKVRLPVGGRMETLKNFNPSKCESKDLLNMTSLRIFSIRSFYTFHERDELKGVMEAPAMKKSGQVINTVRLVLDPGILKKDPTILRCLAGPPSSFGLTLYSTKGITLKEVVSRIGGVDSLEVLELEGAGVVEIGEDDVLALRRLGHLKYVCVLNPLFGEFKGPLLSGCGEYKNGLPWEMKLASSNTVFYCSWRITS